MNAAERLADPDFGNYMVHGLREIALPEPPSYRPQTIGWAILAGLALLGLLIWGIQRYRRWRRDRYRRAALQRLAALEKLAPVDQATALTQLPLLLKQTALAAYPREQVAQLSGKTWLTFLDGTYPGQSFTQGSGCLLAQLPYQPPAHLRQLPAANVTALIAAARTWIATHQPPTPHP